MQWENKSVMVVGMARSGIAAAMLLCKSGAQPLVIDQKTRDAFDGSLNILNNYNIRWHLGEEPEAYFNQIDAIVISPGVPIQSNFIQKAKALNIPVIGELELASQLAKGELIAVTGTNGKTTTVTLLGEIFKNAGKVSHVAGNVGYPFSMAAMQSQCEDIIIAEVSSFQLEAIRSFHPKIAAVLNITEDHLNRHGTMQEYIRLKQRIFENQTNSDVAVLNYDDMTLREMGKKLSKSHRVAWFSRVSQVPEGAFIQNNKIMMAWNGEERAVCDIQDITIPGPHNLENALAATAIAISLEVPAPVIRHSLRTFTGVEHRIERVRVFQGVTYINDSKGTNVDSTIKAVQTMQAPTVIILGGYDKQADFEPLAQEIINHSQIAHAVLIGQTANQIKKALQAKGFEHISEAKNMHDAINISKNIAKEGWNVLLSPACASFDMFSDYEQRGRVFKEIVQEL